MQPIKNMRRLIVVGGGLIGLGIVIGMFSGLLPGFGGGGPGNGVQVKALATRSQQDQTPPDKQPAEDLARSKAEIKQPQDVVNVLIDGRSYFVRRIVAGVLEYQPIELSQLVELAKVVRGDEDGIHVRIGRRKSARASAEEMLQEKLVEAGLSKESLHWQEGWVP